jgi:hypothetical protein
MKSHGLTVTSCLLVLGIALSSSAALAYQGPAVRMGTAPAVPPRHANPTPAPPPPVVVPLYMRPPPIVTPDHGPNPSA